MADNKKSDTASDETERPEDDLDTVNDSAPPDDNSDPDAEGKTSRSGDDSNIEDAEIVEEIPAEPDDTVVSTEASEALEPEWTDESAETSEASDLTEKDFPDPDAVSDQELNDLERLDGAQTEDAASSADLDRPDAETVDDETGDVAEAEPSPQASVAQPEPVPTPSPEVHTVEKETVVVEKKSGGVLPGFVGGLVAATGLAFAAPYVIPAKMLPSFPNEELEGQIAVQSETVSTLQASIADLQGQLEAKAAADDLVSLRSSLDETAGQITGVQQAMATSAGLEEVKAGLEAPVAETAARLETLSALADEMTQRVHDLEKRPIAEANDPRAVAAVQAYGREVEGFKGQLVDLQAAVKDQMAQAESLVVSSTAAADDAVRTALADSEEKIAAAEAAAKATEEQAAAEAAAAAEQALQATRAQIVVDIQSALDSGEPFDAKLAGLEGLAVSDALASVAADGIATQTELQETYTSSARSALAAARKEAAGEDMGGKITSFVETQLGIRSLAPAEGDSPDAVLSRAEAATRSGALQDAVSELSSLPESGQSAMADWVAQATARAEALAAADELAASLATN